MDRSLNLVALIGQAARVLNIVTNFSKSLRLAEPGN